jgi:hypothetical protein
MNFTQSIMRVLGESGGHMRAADVRRIVETRFPDMNIPKSTVDATLHKLYKEERVGRMKGHDGRYEYCATPGERSRSGSDTNRLSLNFGENVSAGGLTMVDRVTRLQEDKQKVLSYKATVALPIDSAIAAVLGTDDLASTLDFASRALDLFCFEKPWLEEDFFWVRCQGVRTVSLSISVSRTRTPKSYTALREMLGNKFEGFGSPVMARDKGMHSVAQVMKSSYFSTTAIIWHLINHLPDDAREHEDVQRFFVYASENYVNREDAGTGIDVVSAYSDIYKRLAAKKVHHEEVIRPAPGSAEATVQPGDEVVLTGVVTLLCGDYIKVRIGDGESVIVDAKNVTIHVRHPQ